MPDPPFRGRHFGWLEVMSHPCTAIRSDEKTGNVDRERVATGVAPILNGTFQRTLFSPNASSRMYQDPREMGLFGTWPSGGSDGAEGRTYRGMASPTDALVLSVVGIEEQRLHQHTKTLVHAHRTPSFTSASRSRKEFASAKVAPFKRGGTRTG